MDDKITKVREVLTKKEISNIKFIIFLIGVGVFIFMDTGLFRDLNDSLKILIYLTLWGSFVLLKLEIMPTKALANNIKEIIANKALKPEEMIMQITQKVAEAMIQLGKAWEIFDQEQFPEKEPIPDKVDYVYKGDTGRAIDGTDYTDTT